MQELHASQDLMLNYAVFTLHLSKLGGLYGLSKAMEKLQLWK